MLKILYITNYPSPYAVEFFNELGKRCSLTVTFEQTPEEVKERNTEWFHASFRHFNGVFLKKETLFGRTICREVKNYIVSDFDCIIMGEYSSFTEMFAIRYMKKHRIPYCFAIDGGIRKNGRGLKEKLKKYLVRGAAFYLSSGLVTDDFLCFYGAKRDRIFRYPYTSLNEADIVDKVPSEEEKRALREKLGISAHKMVLSVGQFIPRKGFDVLIRAATMLDKETHVYIVGGEATEEYITLREKVGAERVHFVGFMPKEKLKEYYLAADVFVMPTREDIWGLVINEAMACGLPVVSTGRCVAGVELVDERKGGFIVSVEDEKELAEKTNVILRDSALRRGMADYNLRKIYPYTIENMAARHMEIIERYCQK